MSNYASVFFGTSQTDRRRVNVTIRPDGHGNTLHMHVGPIDIGIVHDGDLAFLRELGLAYNAELARYTRQAQVDAEAARIVEDVRGDSYRAVPRRDYVDAEEQAIEAEARHDAMEDR